MRYGTTVREAKKLTSLFDGLGVASSFKVNKKIGLRSKIVFAREPGAGGAGGGWWRCESDGRNSVLDKRRCWGDVGLQIKRNGSCDPRVEEKFVCSEAFFFVNK